MNNLREIEVLDERRENSRVEDRTTNREQQLDASIQTSNPKKPARYVGRALKAVKFTKKLDQEVDANHDNSNEQHSPTQSTSPPISRTNQIPNSNAL
jgi:hypothetical protein